MDKSGANPAAVQQELTGFAKFKAGVASVNRVINIIGMVFYRLRKVVLSVPVVYYALKRYGWYYDRYLCY